MSKVKGIVLSCETQIQARKELRKTILAKEEAKQVTLYNNETKKYDLNKDCESKVMDGYFSIHNNTPSSQIQEQVHNRPTFESMAPLLTVVHFGRHKIKGSSKSKPNCDQLKAFIQVRHKITNHKGGSPVYKSLQKVKWDGLIDLCMDVVSKPVQPWQFRS